MIEVLKAYLQVVSGVGELTRQRALEAARQALAATPASVVLPVASAGVDTLAAQASALADELLAAGRQNREMISHLVRAEVDTVVARLGLDGRAAELEAALAASQSRVRDLERGAGRPAARKSTAKKSTAKKSTAKKSAAKKSAATKSASAAKTSTTTKAAAKRSTTKTSTAKKSTAKKSTAKTSTAKRSGTTAGTAQQSTAASSPDQA